MSKLIGIIGCGNMGKAMLARNSLHACGKKFIIFDKDKAKGKLSAKSFGGVKTARAISDLASKSNVIIIAVKPQDIDVVLEQISGLSQKIIKNKLIISIAAGISTEYIKSKITGKPRVIRAMPNMAAAIGEGITALCRGRFASIKDLKLAQAIFDSLGATVILNKEELIDVVTALSGSGPAYIFYIYSVMAKTARELGLGQKNTRQLIYQTVIGSMKLLFASKFEAEDLISKVASKGGTTQAALSVFEECHLDKILRQAIISAYKRAGELSR